MKEEWRDIPGYEGLYQVSNLGRVRSLDRYVDHGQTKALRKGRILKQGRASGGYMMVQLCNGGGGSNKLVHRLVADLFVPNVENLAEVNHKDENKENNRADNLEWCTRSYNINYGNGNAKRVKDKLIAVEMYTLDGTKLQEFSSVNEAARAVCGSAGNISMCCKGKRTTAKGYIWKYKE